MFADNLKTLRRARGLSQEELAGRLHVTRQTISKWENALSVPDAELLLRLAEELEVPVSRLLGGPVEEEPAPDQVAAHLAELNRLLAERNRRSRRIWRGVAGVLLGPAGGARPLGPPPAPPPPPPTPAQGGEFPPPGRSPQAFAGWSPPQGSGSPPQQIPNACARRTAATTARSRSAPRPAFFPSMNSQIRKRSRSIPAA